MKIYKYLLFLLPPLFAFNKPYTRMPKVLLPGDGKFYDFRIPSIDGDIIDFSKYKGKKVLIVNVASKCGNTPQYEKLQELNDKYGNLVTILGFPCNDFAGQEPGSAEEIKQFCKKNYGVTFQLFEKVSVKGKNKHPLYQWLTDKNKNGWNTEEPGWNFGKYLINEKGELIKYYSAGMNPLSKEIVDDIHKK
ncbi:MAG TPA: glutathione peroxidase [Cytophagaceae bacterium]|jgi:glutathione peroxidase|nr:glutathione peroxidase [Cytophagaceae bacterium]